MLHLHARLSLHDEGGGAFEESLFAIDASLNLTVLSHLVLKHHCGTRASDRRHNFVDR